MRTRVLRGGVAFGLGLVFALVLLPITAHAWTSFMPQPGAVQIDRADDETDTVDFTIYTRTAMPSASSMTDGSYDEPSNGWTVTQVVRMDAASRSMQYFSATLAYVMVADEAGNREYYANQGVITKVDIARVGGSSIAATGVPVLFKTPPSVVGTVAVSSVPTATVEGTVSVSNLSSSSVGSSMTTVSVLGLDTKGIQASSYLIAIMSGLGVLWWGTRHE